MKKASALLSLLAVIILLSGCAGMGGAGRNEDHFAGATANIGSNSILSIIGDKTKQVGDVQLDLFGALEPVLRVELSKSGFKEGPIEMTTPGFAAVLPAVGQGKNFQITIAAHVEVEADEVVQMRTAIWISRPPQAKGEKAEKVFSKNYVATLFVDKVMASGPDAQERVNKALQEKYKGIAPQIANDLLGLKIQL